MSFCRCGIYLSIFNGEKLVSILKPYSLARHCQAGQSFHAYDIDGKKYPCHVFSGNTLKSNEWEKVSCVDFHDDSMFDDPDCKECPIHNICPTCYGMNFIERGSLYSRDKNMCKFIIAEKIATCKLYKHRIMSKDINDISEQEYLNWIKKGTFIQDEFPELDPNERELLISQTCGNCWNKIFNIDEI